MILFNTNLVLLSIGKNNPVKSILSFRNLINNIRTISRWVEYFTQCWTIYCKVSKNISCVTIKRLWDSETIQNVYTHKITTWLLRWHKSSSQRGETLLVHMIGINLLIIRICIQLVLFMLNICLPSTNFHCGTPLIFSVQTTSFSRPVLSMCLRCWPILHLENFWNMIMRIITPYACNVMLFLMKDFWQQSEQYNP